MYKNSTRIIFYFIILFISFSYSELLCQIPNAGFESWTNGNPDGWTTDNDQAQGFVFVTPTTDVHSGNYALKGVVISDQGFTLNPVIFTVFPYSRRSTHLTGYYKFTPVDGDSLRILVSLGGNRDSAGAGGGGSLILKNTVNNYTKFDIPIYWASKYQPDSCVINFTIFPNPMKSHAGTAYYIDDLSLSGNATYVKNNSTNAPQSFELSQNYPNPFNPSTTIDYQIPMNSYVTLNVYDILGNKVAELVNRSKTPGRYSVTFNAGRLSSGIYIYRLTAVPKGINSGNFIQTKKLILLK